jgi:hypothetical protein
MKTFQKIDCIVQSILVIASLTIILLPLLGLWQIISVLVYTFTKSLTYLHKIYILILFLATAFILSISLNPSERGSGLTCLIFFGYVLGAFYYIISCKTLEK